MADTPLITLQTDLKSLRYGSDKPYVTKNIGQAPGSQVGQEVTRRIDDTSRIAQMLVDKPGLKYLLHEAELQQVDLAKKIKNRGNKTVAGAILNQLGNTAINTVKIVGSTLAQVPVNGTGTHFLKGFRTDTYLQPTNGNQFSGFARFFGAGGIEGAPLALEGKVIPSTPESVVSNFETGDVEQLQPGFTEYSNTGSYVQSITQPGVVNSISRSGTVAGSIPVRGYTDTETNPADELGLLVPTNSRDTREDSYGKNSSDYKENITGFEPVKSQFWEEGEGIPTANVSSHLVNQNTVRSLNNEVKSSEERLDTNSVESKYYEQQKRRKINGTEKNVIKDTRVNLGDQGRKKAATYYTDYSNTDELSIDKLNALDIQNSRPDGINEARDLAKFFFEIITPEGSKFLNFRAFITSMDDNYNANWESKKYVGRADDFYTYGGFSRDISVGFKIAAATRSEMKPLYKKMVYLASTTAPTYGDYKFMRGTVVRLSLGSYFNEIPGVITSVKYTWSTDYPWEIAMESPEGGETGVQELPMIMDCSISFKPIHDFVPQTGLQHYITSKEPNKTFF
jgi:hypothetical protein